MNTKSRSKRLKNQEVEVEKKEENMKTIAIVSLLCLGMFLAMGTGVVFAAEDTRTQTSTVNLAVPANCKLEITGANQTKELTADQAVAAFDDTFIVLNANEPTLKVSANKKWVLSAKSGGFGAVGSYTKAIGDLQLKDAGTANVVMGDFTGLLATDQTVASYTIGVKKESHPCQYKILLDYTKDIPGTYTATVTYTLATQAS